MYISIYVCMYIWIQPIMNILESESLNDHLNGLGKKNTGKLHRKNGKKSMVSG